MELSKQKAADHLLYMKEQAARVRKLDAIWHEHLLAMVEAGVDLDDATRSMFSIACLSRATVHGDEHTSGELFLTANYYGHRHATRAQAQADAVCSRKH